MKAWLLAVVLAACVGPVAAEMVVIAAEDDWAPYSSKRFDSKEPEGFAPELVREAFATQGVEVQFLTVPFSRCLLLAEEGKQAVACFDVTITDANRDQYVWHPTPLFKEGLAIFGRADEPRQDLKTADLDGHSVGITNGYTYPTAFMENPAIERFTANSDAQLLQMLSAGRVDYILMNTMPGLMRIQQSGEFRGRVKQVGLMQEDGFWLAFSKVNPDGARLAAVFEKGLQALRSTGRYQKMLADFQQRYRE
ncbi:substrate-binding periplasmic protein [Metapseudomonas otitidis]|uniref:substrate-binding periplasmic protein n=1 Tax=Metapseudomonas otitidis TaxID=319939 RepID=UPI00280AB2C7|nr:transporter substrate-binding domain-containing protein [Pseudomonas otitidis]